MPNSLLTGVSGLIAHQRMLDVVSNNLANLNTVGYKQQRIHFADMFYSSLRPASNASAQDSGGINPQDIGTGVRIGQVQKTMSQGNMEQTGEVLDFAIQGDGFFVLNTGQRNLYTRAGSFGLDGTGYLVDPSTGFRVQRFGAVGEGDEVNPGFQTAGSLDVHVPFGAGIPGEPTSAISLRGNLNANTPPAQAAVLASPDPFTSGGVAATAATLLNSLDSNTSAYVVGDTIEISATNGDGSSSVVSLAVDGTTSLGELVAAVNGAFTDATASLDDHGRIVLTAQEAGSSQLGLAFSDAAGNAGSTELTSHTPATTVAGSDGGRYQSAVEVFDVRGGSHTVTLTLQKQTDDRWNLTASMNSDQGTIVDNSIEGIVFNDDGSLQQITGTGLGDSNLAFQFNGIAATQTIAVSFGPDNSFQGVTQMATASAIASEQNGFPPGTLTNVTVTSDGVLVGVASNGKRFPVAQLAVASFRNPQGLRMLGDNYYEESLSTGDVQIGSALSGDRGTITAGQLETSNVEVALEFTRLIVAQRGFSANARTITVSNEMLQELTNIIR